MYKSQKLNNEWAKPHLRKAHSFYIVRFDKLKTHKIKDWKVFCRVYVDWKAVFYSLWGLKSCFVDSPSKRKCTSHRNWILRELNLIWPKLRASTQSDLWNSNSLDWGLKNCFVESMRIDKLHRNSNSWEDWELLCRSALLKEYVQVPKIWYWEG